MTVIGQIAIKNIRSLKSDGNESCFVIKSMYSFWKVCAASMTESQEWQCAIKYAMMDPCTGSGGGSKSASPMSQLVGK